MVSPKEITILIVDDDEELLNSIATSFRLFQFKVIEKRSGNEAIEYLKEDDTVSLVISDIRMPNGSGIDVLEFVRKRSSKTPRVLFISGYSDYTISEMYDKGVDGFFAKPFRVSAIKDAITKTLLNLNERWRQPVNGQMTMMINKTVSSLNLKDDAQFILGRGGFFVELGHKSPKVDDIVGFEIKIKNNEPISILRGQGRVRWVRSGDNDQAKGAGIEIEHVDESCRSKFVDWVIRQNFISYIPE